MDAQEIIRMEVIKTKKKERTGAPKDPFYNSKQWRQFRNHYIKQNPYCVECAKKGRVELSTVADHIQQRSQGGMDFEYSNLQALCDRCHNIKRAEESKRAKAI